MGSPLPGISNSPRSSATCPTPLTPSPYSRVLNLLMTASLGGCAIIVLLMVTLPPPPRYPFLWPLLSSVYSAAHFIFFAVYYHYLQFTYKNEYKMDKKIK